MEDVYTSLYTKKGWQYSWENGVSTLATSCEELTHWKRLWCWEGLGARGKGDNRGWDGWMAPLTRWTWVWVNSRSWCWTGRPGVLRFMGSQRVGHKWATDLIWSDLIWAVHTASVNQCLHNSWLCTDKVLEDESMMAFKTQYSLFKTLSNFLFFLSFCFNFGKCYPYILQN